MPTRGPTEPLSSPIWPSRVGPAVAQVNGKQLISAHRVATLGVGGESSAVAADVEADEADRIVPERSPDREGAGVRWVLLGHRIQGVVDVEQLRGHGASHVVGVRGASDLGSVPLSAPVYTRSPSTVTAPVATSACRFWLLSLTMRRRSATGLKSKPKTLPVTGTLSVDTSVAAAVAAAVCGRSGCRCLERRAHHRPAESRSRGSTHPESDPPNRRSR